MLASGVVNEATVGYKLKDGDISVGQAVADSAINVVMTAVGSGIGLATDEAFKLANAARDELAAVGNEALRKAVNFFTGFPAALAGVLDIGMDDSGGLGAGLGE